MEITSPDSATPGTRGLIAFTSPDELLKQDQEEAKKQAEEEQTQPLVLGLAGHIKTRWQDVRAAKQQDIEPRLLNCLRLRKGTYDAQTLARIRAQGGTDLFIKLITGICRSAKAWMSDIFASTEKPFMIKPTPVPELPPAVEAQVAEELALEYQKAAIAHQQAGVVLDEAAFRKQAEEYQKNVLQDLRDKAIAELETLENEINDDLVEGGWYEALDAILWDVVTFPFAVLKGPIVRMSKILKWGEDGSPIVEEVPKKHWERVNPFDIYPSRNAKTIQDGDLIERHRLSKKALLGLIGIEGYSETAIRKVLSEHDSGGLKMWLTSDQERQQLEGKPDVLGSNDLIDALQFWGSVSGKLLIEWDSELEEQIPEPTDEYQVEAWLIGDTVISAVLNPDPLDKRPYYSASYDTNPDSICGESPTELAEDVQQICNSSARAMVNNMGLASGPQVAILADLLQPGMDITTMAPWRIWQFTAEQFASGRMPIQFFQPDPILDALIRVYDYFFKQASEVTGIPAYIAGSDKMGGAAKTASGLSMLMNAANKGLKDVIKNIDQGIIQPSVRAEWQHTMLYEPEKAKGDINIVAKTSQYLIMLEGLQMRRMEFLSNTNNPTDNQIVGLTGRAEILRETAKILQLPVDRIVPDKQSILNNVHEAKVQEILMNLSQATGIPIEQLAQVASGQGGGGGQSPQTLNLAGQPMGGV